MVKQSTEQGLTGKIPEETQEETFGEGPTALQEEDDKNPNKSQEKVVTSMEFRNIENIDGLLKKAENNTGMVMLRALIGTEEFNTPEDESGMEYHTEIDKNTIGEIAPNLYNTLIELGFPDKFFAGILEIFISDKKGLTSVYIQSPFRGNGKRIEIGKTEIENLITYVKENSVQTSLSDFMGYDSEESDFPIEDRTYKNLNNV